MTLNDIRNTNKSIFIIKIINVVRKPSAVVLFQMQYCFKIARLSRRSSYKI